MKFVFSILIFLPPFLAGLGYISPYWMLGSVVVAYGKSILVVGAEAGVRDFRDLSTDEFVRRDRGIKFKVLGHALAIAALYGIGRLVAQLL